MQSGITASKELNDAFQSLASDYSQRGLIASISKSPESLIPEGTISSSSQDFAADLSNVSQHLTDDKAAYLILRQSTPTKAGVGSFIAVTYVPDKAPVRQKMLFASTRLTLVRELGLEHFCSTLLATSKDELTAEGWARHEAHGSLSAPLTEEESNLQGIRDAEAQESTGTSARKAHVSSGVNLPVSIEAIDALKRLQSGEEGLIQLKIDVPNEKILLESVHPSSSASPSSLNSLISSSEPRYSFYSHVLADSSKRSILFIYSCPSSSKVRERMLYASSRASVMALVKDEAGVDVAKKMEVSEPAEITEQSVLEELEDGPKKSIVGSGADGRVFGRPKRPGKR